MLHPYTSLVVSSGFDSLKTLRIDRFLVFLTIFLAAICRLAGIRRQEGGVEGFTGVSLWALDSRPLNRSRRSRTSLDEGSSAVGDECAL